MLFKRLIPLLILLGTAQNSHAMLARSVAALRNSSSTFVNATADKAANLSSRFSSLRPTKTLLQIGIATAATLGCLKAYCHDKENAPQYTINLMWINRSLQENQKYIFPAKDEDDLKEKYLTPILNWSKLHPDNTVQVWFDSSFTTQKAPLDTLNKIKEHTTKAIVLKDVRDIPEVKNNAKVFSNKTPVYFRADLLRVMAAVHTLSTHKADHFVYADFDVKPLSKQELFDKTTLQQLKEFGFVMAKDECSGFENSFQITSKHSNLINAIKRTLIDLNIKRAHHALDGVFFDSSGMRDPQHPMKPLQQIVYSSYPSMFNYFCHLQGWGKLKLANGIMYDHQQHGLEPFGLYQLHNAAKLVIYNSDLKEKITKKDILIPTKKVSAPPASLKYD